MKRILMRAGMSPLLNYEPTEVIVKNLFGNNIGNMLFQSSVCRALLREKVIIDTIHTKRKYSNEDIKKINSTYECLVLPFANAFRKEFIDELKNTTELVNKLKIPCIVIGVGAQASLKKEVDSPELDLAVQEFMKAILKKSSKVGLRGEFTAEYLTKLGFQAERDFTVIGCPSLYMFGKELPEMEVKELTPESSVSMNSKISLPQKFHDFMYRSSRKLPDHYYVPQVIEEINRMYIGKPYPKGFVSKYPKHFPVDFTSEIYTSGRGLAFTNMPSWLEYLRERDFSFGSRIHGNIAAILAGTPSYVIVSDRRIMELVDYHNIPHLLMHDLKKETDIFDLYEKADFSALRRGHEERFGHYLDFLHESGLKTIFDEDYEGEEIPFDRKIASKEFPLPEKAFSFLSQEEQLERLERVHQEESRKNKYFRDAFFQPDMNAAQRIKYILKGGRREMADSYYPLIREFKEEKKQERKKRRRRENEAEES